jgi:S-adenosylmethionine hydrolase
LRGVLLSRAPGAVLADISHDIPPGDVRAGAYVLGRSWHAFPAGTVYLAVVDPGVGGERAALAVRCEGRFFVGPDNGLFTPVLDRAEEIAVLAVPPLASPTFHGRDLFAPAAAALAGGSTLRALGPAPQGALVRLPMSPARRDGGAMIGEVVYIDRFGTLVTNLTPDAAGAVEIAGVRVPLRRTFSDVAPEQPVAYVGSGGTIELAVRGASAAERFKAYVGLGVRSEGGG